MPNLQKFRNSKQISVRELIAEAVQAKVEELKKPRYLTKVDGTDPSIVRLHRCEWRPDKRW